jgi:hypothetical protein
MRDRERYRFAAAAFRPDLVLQYLWRLIPLGSFRRRLAFDIITPPHFAYGLYQAALTAQRLGIPRISAIEFGVAGGSGLVALERVAEQVTGETGVEIAIYGFDTGTGLPEPKDYRDMPYLYRGAQLRMDEAKLRDRLNVAQLVLGDVAETVSTFFEEYSPPPVGFVSFDVVYHSSSTSALKLFDTDSKNLLPRVFCHFDDIIGDDLHIHNEWVGELLAIRDFNDNHSIRKLAKIYGLRHKRITSSEWHDNLYVLHDFQHPLYGRYIRPGDLDRQLPLQDTPRGYSR